MDLKGITTETLPCIQTWDFPNKESCKGEIFSQSFTTGNGINHVGSYIPIITTLLPVQNKKHSSCSELGFRAVRMDSNCTTKPRHNTSQTTPAAYPLPYCCSITESIGAPSIPDNCTHQDLFPWPTFSTSAGRSVPFYEAKLKVRT